MNEGLRFVSSVEELDALPLMSVIMATKPSRSVFQKWRARDGRTPKWVRMKGDLPYTSEELCIGMFPLTAPQQSRFVVLYDPAVHGDPSEWESASAQA
ncbi:hypothetical protein [Nocardia pseudobrasiliensis]|uniref:Uncharacterized protein n=1 Tax=Nocardia pseudobrasiliensis TaxID=45979 RepID=A0A370I292_9NOCA|nr:hypothetical protein [Nocardia pseudobrasiliensis]RDI64867.1 hypothetical protein DFR76_107244 [Nocardia pseudobrasiliensis]